MKINAIITSCARPEMLERTVLSFRDNVVFSGELRLILVEDFVEDKARRNTGRSWIEKNSGLFDEVIVMKENIGPYHQFQNASKMVTTPYMFKLDDDAEFVRKINLDSMCNIMDSDESLAQLILRRPDHAEVLPRVERIAGEWVIVHNFYSISFGMHRMSDVNRLFDKVGWEAEAHETSVLTPVALGMGMRCGIFGNDVVHYRHVGGELGYDKGAWK